MAIDSLNALQRIGLLLKADPALPSVTTIVAGEPVRGSWWAHPAGRRIFQTLRDLSQHPDIVFVKLQAARTRSCTAISGRSCTPRLPADKSTFGPTGGEREVAPSCSGIDASCQGARGGLEKNGSPKRIVTVSVARNIRYADERRDRHSLTAIDGQLAAPD
jgi:hypothetical protein